MERHLDDQAYDAVIAALPPGGEQTAVAAHLQGCDACRHEWATTADALALLALPLPLAPPPLGARERLLEATQTGRFADFIPRVAHFFDVAQERAAELLDWLDEPARWETLMDWFHVIHLDGGPAVAGADAGFVRLRAGSDFPQHRHVGEERIFMLQGSIHLDGGGILRRGEVLLSTPGSLHSLHVGEDVDCIYALVLYRGIEIVQVMP